MTDIGIYGDSFAIDRKYSWINYLRQNLNAKITSYAQSGSDIMFSYSEFYKNYQNHDLNIFVLTEPSRDHVFVRQEGKLVYKNFSLESDLSSFDKKVIELSDLKRSLFPESWHYRTLAVLDSLFYRDENVVIINALDALYSNSMLFNLQRLDFKFFYNNRLLIEKENDDRFCHLSKKQNEEFAKYLTMHITDNFDFNQTLLEENLTKYYTISKTKEEAGID